VAANFILKAGINTINSCPLLRGIALKLIMGVVILNESMMKMIFFG